MGYIPEELHDFPTAEPICPERLFDVQPSGEVASLTQEQSLYVQCPPSCAGPCEVPMLEFASGLFRQRVQRVVVRTNSICADELNSIKGH